jgi:hypothetical protein
MLPVMHGSACRWTGTHVFAGHDALTPAGHVVGQMMGEGHADNTDVSRTFLPISPMGIQGEQESMGAAITVIGRIGMNIGGLHDDLHYLHVSGNVNKFHLRRVDG